MDAEVDAAALREVRRIEGKSVKKKGSRFPPPRRSEALDGDAEVARAITTQRMVETLREKDVELDKVCRRVEAVEAEKSGLEATLASKAEALALVEGRLATAEAIAEKESARATEVQLELSRVKGLLATSQFELDLADTKYARLLEATAKDRADRDRDLVVAKAVRPGKSRRDDDDETQRNATQTPS